MARDPEYTDYQNLANSIWGVREIAEDDPFGKAVPKDDPVSPNHYRFPGGVEVIEISQHLTSMGGQALQYIARATRLDGNNKGNPVEDLQKAKVFIDAEIERLSRG